MFARRASNLLLDRPSLFSSPLCLRRTFFASSTDHTRLLKEAEVHCLDQEDGSMQYVMVAGGTDKGLVRKVPQLHLARLNLKDRTLYGAKVVNRTLGRPTDVCGKLVDAAIKDVGSGIQARSTLYGLTDWVLKGVDNRQSIESLARLSDFDLAVVKGIAKGDVKDTNKAFWEDIVREFVNKRLGEEAALYQDRGGKLVAIEHNADDTEYTDSSAGTMAVFTM